MMESPSLLGSLLGSITFLVVVVVTQVLLTPIIWPMIVAFPWKDHEKEDRIVILAGSYNPPHLGHLAMLEYISKR
jgi:hypothetical protein